MADLITRIKPVKGKALRVDFSTKVGYVVEQVPIRATLSMKLLDLRKYVKKFGLTVIPVFKSIFSEKPIGYVLAQDVLLATTSKSAKKVGDVVREDVVLEGSMTIEEAYRELKSRNLVGAMVVDSVENKNFLGVVTIRGLLGSLMDSGVEPKAKSVNEIYSEVGSGSFDVVEPNERVDRIWHRIAGGEILGVVVVNPKDRSPLGVVTCWDFLKTRRWFFHREVEPRSIVTQFVERGVSRGETRRVGIMRARKLMTEGIPAATPRTPVKDVAALILSAGIDLVPVVNEKEDVIGVVTIWDVARAWFEGAKEGGEYLEPVPIRPIEEVVRGVRRLTPEEITRLKPVVHVIGVRARQLALVDLPTVHVNDPVSRVRKLMVGSVSKVIAVVDDSGKILGFISRRDLLYYLAERREYWKVQRGWRLVLSKDVMSGEEARILVKEATAGQIMRTEYPVVDVNATAEEIAYQMIAYDTDFAVVRDRDRVVGVVTKDSLLKAYLDKGRDATVGEFMVPARMASVDALNSITHVIRKMRMYGLDGVVVVEGGRIKGVVHEDDLALRPIEETLRGERLVFISVTKYAGEVKRGIIKLGTWVAEQIAQPLKLTVKEGERVKEVVKRMLEEDISAIPVVDEGGNLVGLITKMEVIKDLARAYVTTARAPPIKVKEEVERRVEEKR